MNKVTGKVRIRLKVNIMNTDKTPIEKENQPSRLGGVRGSRLILDLSDEGKYFVKIENGNIVFKPDKFGEASKFECLYWIYMNGDCYYR